MKITTKKADRPIKMVVYGVEGVGKTTFASQAPSPIFLCAEDGTPHLDVTRLCDVDSWLGIRDALRSVATEDHAFKSIVVDSVDWIEPILWRHLCESSRKQSIEDFGYGKGYAMALEIWREFVGLLDACVNRGMHAILLAHAAIKRVDDPYAGAFDRYRMKLHERASDMLKEWSDAVLFARHEVILDPSKKARAIGTGERIAHTQWTAAFDAKNRFGLPDTIPLNWDHFYRLAKPERALSEAVAKLQSMMSKEKFEEAIAWCGSDLEKVFKVIKKKVQNG